MYFTNHKNEKNTLSTCNFQQAICFILLSEQNFKKNILLSVKKYFLYNLKLVYASFIEYVTYQDLSMNIQSSSNSM